MVNLRAIAFINGIAVCGLGVAMLIPFFLDLFLWNSKCTEIFMPSILFCIFLGGLTALSCRTAKDGISLERKDTYFLVTSLWFVISIVSAFPFYIYPGEKLNFISALFEAASGITTTGATIYQNVEGLPRALLLWRFILHFLGGVGIVAIGLVALPIMRIGGMQLFMAEHYDKSQKFFPRVSQIAGFFVGSYITIICIFIILLNLSGMSLFDSVCYSISAISTGGFSTKNIGISAYGSNSLLIIMSIAMFMGGITFIEIVKGFRTKFKSLFQNQQVLGYFKLTICAILLPLVAAIVFKEKEISTKNISEYIFQVVSAITTTGFDAKDSFISPKILLLFFAVVGGCSGSTAGGIKIFRIQILYSIVKHHINQLARPFDVKLSKYQGQRISENLETSVISLLAILVLTFITSVALLSLVSGIGSTGCAYCVTSCLFNLGYETEINNFSAAGKLILITDMIIGRLELIPFFILFTKSFWK